MTGHVEVQRYGEVRGIDHKGNTFPLSIRMDARDNTCGMTQRDFEPNYRSIPPHGRWQHFEVGGQPRIDRLMALWSTAIDAQERTRRLLDLFVVSVLLDAGAGTRWQYKSNESGEVFKRSEGLAIASLEMFKMGTFSSNPDQPHRVDSAALKRLTNEELSKGLQVSDQNPMDGLEGRTNLLIRLGEALSNERIFGKESRPGNLLDYLLSHPSTQCSAVPVVALPTLWDALMSGLSPIWPESRTQINGISIGDAWPCDSMPSDPEHPWKSIVPFHKLTQCKLIGQEGSLELRLTCILSKTYANLLLIACEGLAYSLLLPMQKLSCVHFVGVELLTGLPEYRNGGLLLDTGLLTLKGEDMKRGLEQYHANAARHGRVSMEVVPLFTVDDSVIVEWRAVTVGYLDLLLQEVNALLELKGSSRISLAQMLEAGTW